MASIGMLDPVEDVDISYIVCSRGGSHHLFGGGSPKMFLGSD